MSDEDDRAVMDIPAGDRRSGNIDILVLEAELTAEGADLDNAAKPATADVAEAVIDRLDDGVRPAWEVVG